MADFRRRYLLAYDISDEKRLRQVHKVVKGFGWPMQYSVFICDLDKMELIALRSELGRVMHHQADSVAIIDLGEPRERGRSCFEFMGRAPTLPRSGPLIV